MTILTYIHWWHLSPMCVIICTHILRKWGVVATQELHHFVFCIPEGPNQCSPKVSDYCVLVTLWLISGQCCPPDWARTCACEKLHPIYQKGIEQFSTASDCFRSCLFFSSPAAAIPLLLTATYPSVIGQKARHFKSVRYYTAART